MDNKKALSVLVLLMCSIPLLGQHEFQRHENDLIYDPATMRRLKAMGDSLHLTCKNCDAPPPYHSRAQGRATYYLFDKNISRVQQAIRQNVSPDDLLREFPPARVQKNVNVARTEYTYKKEKTVVYVTFPHVENDRPLSVKLAYLGENVKTRGWVTNGNSAFLWGYYLNDLAVKEIPRQYARLLQYVDCMIDTSSHVFLDPSGPVRSDGTKEKAMSEQFIKWANDFPGKPVLDVHPLSVDATDEQVTLLADRYEKYSRDYRQWDKQRLADLDVRMRESRYWRYVLRELTNTAVKQGYAEEEMEDYIERYISPEVALYLKRKRRVTGTCSMDERPRIHALNISRLAALTGNWNVFLRSHLDLLNDGFERTSDGSWAYEARQTYVAELESLGINAPDLLLGAVLSTSSAGANHYSADVARVGRALAETSDRDKIEKRLKTMINDPQLDPFNRSLLQIVFQHYRAHLKAGRIQ